MGRQEPCAATRTARTGPAPAGAPEPPITIHTLGRFQVLRYGKPVAPGVWQSKKARDLVKILVSRRGRPIMRDVLMEALWPNERPEKVANRLSVALSTARGVLDPDKCLGPDGLISSDQATTRLAVERLTVDVEEFLADAAAGLSLWRQGCSDQAVQRLGRAEAAYAGDFLEENLYEDWSASLRDEAKATYLQVARVLTLHAGRSRDYEAVVRYQLRILERDRYDERANLLLVAALCDTGSHGEARRHYRAYVARMAEIGVHAEDFPSSGLPDTVREHATEA